MQPLPGAIFQQNKARPNTTREKRLSPHCYYTQLSARSPDLSQIENLWDHLGRTAKAGSDVAQSGSPIFDDFLQHLWPYIGNNTANVVFQMVKRLWLILIDQ
ncbi:hypothetical protein TNCV_711461 [Trichonephila clavipes]|nr:hypothetical protein TNCV_711461 [Trichonephila clavipes]